MRTFALVAVLVSSCCAHVVAPTPAPPAPSPDAASSPATCADVCEHEFSLGCPAAEPTSDGRTCLDVCQNVTTSGFTAWDLGCMATAPTCAAVDACSATLNNR
jgi:hypothetical protein